MTGLVESPLYRAHDPGPGHPERPERYDAALKGVAGAVSPASILRLAPRPATMEDLVLGHSPSYVLRVKEDIEAGIGSLTTGDTDVGAQTWEAALMAAGGVLTAVDAVVSGRVRNAFCPVRPPGHHATPDRGMGFCVFNNVALGALHARVRHGIERVLIVDWDIHHGNGTQAFFESDPSVFYFSTHQWPLYPGTGAAREQGLGAGRGTILNCPLAPGSGRAEVLGAFREKLVPAMDRFRPQFVLVSAGFDGRGGDPLGRFALADDDFADLTALVAEIAARHAGGRLVSALEGGYDLSGLASAVGAHVKALVDSV